MKKGVLILGGILFIALGSIAYKYSTSRVVSPTATPEIADMQLEAPKDGSISVSIDFGNEQQVSFIDEQGAGKTAYDLLLLTAKENGLEVATEKYDFGIFVKAIGKYESSAEKAWIYFVNGQSGSVAADTYVTKSGDKIEWKYIKPTE